MSAKTRDMGVLRSEDPGYDEESRVGVQALASACGWEPQPRKSARLLGALPKTATCLLLFDLLVLGLLLALLHPLISVFFRNNELFGSSFVPSSSKGTSRPGPDQLHIAPDRRIPRILHQTSANETIPDRWARAHQSCKEAYAEFEYKHWTDEKSRNFLASEYPWFLPNWDNYAFDIQRGDAIRYFVLYHFGGIYLDMDLVCNSAISLDQVASVDAPHTALFKSTVPTGVTNSFMIASARHPVLAAAIHKLPKFYTITRFWAKALPYVNIMIATGSLYITLVLRGYLVALPSLPSPTMQVVNATQLEPYITDLNASSWHRGDASILLWLENKPLAWFGLGIIGVISAFYVLNCAVLLVWRSASRSFSPHIHRMKYMKLS